MTTNEGYYGVTRTDEYLAHYGIKGMKWGVRKAIESGNSARLGRQYRKAQKKLAKLEARANNGKKYAKRAAALGAGAAAAGGLALAGTTGVGTALTRAGNAAAAGGRSLGSAMVQLGGTRAFRKKGNKIGQALRTAGNKLQTVAPGASQAAYGASRAVRKWGDTKSGIQTIAGRRLEAQGLKNVAAGGSKAFRKTAEGAAARTVGYNEINKARGMQYTNNQLARLGAGAAAAGLGAGAAYNAYRAATTKRAAKKAAQFRSEMNKAFAGTQYDRRKNRQGGRRRG